MQIVKKIEWLLKLNLKAKAEQPKMVARGDIGSDPDPFASREIKRGSIYF